MISKAAPKVHCRLHRPIALEAGGPAALLYGMLAHFRGSASRDKRIRRGELTKARRYLGFSKDKAARATLKLRQTGWIVGDAMKLAPVHMNYADDRHNLEVPPELYGKSLPRILAELLPLEAASANVARRWGISRRMFQRQRQALRDAQGPPPPRAEDYVGNSRGLLQAILEHRGQYEKSDHT